MARRSRLTPGARREQLLELGTRLLATRPLEELTIDLLAEEAAISRGLLYHYFANKQEFHRAVIDKAVRDLEEATAPPQTGDALERLVGSIEAYVTYVETHFTGYRSLVQAAHRGDPEIRGLYEGARDRLVDRIFVAGGPSAMEVYGLTDTPATRLVLTAWAAFAEELVLGWVGSGTPMSRQQVVEVVVTGLPAMLQAAAPAPIRQSAG